MEINFWDRMPEPCPYSKKAVSASALGSLIHDIDRQRLPLETVRIRA